PAQLQGHLRIHGQARPRDQWSQRHTSGTHGLGGTSPNPLFIRVKIDDPASPSLSATFSNKKEDALGGVPSRPSTTQELSFGIEDVFKK
ncbi:MAG: hypothetical protein ACPIG7_08720, partial [Akkermansiaceae bacterium]